jgi:hypothetical protein
MMYADHAQNKHAHAVRRVSSRTRIQARIVNDKRHKYLLIQYILRTHVQKKKKKKNPFQILSSPRFATNKKSKKQRKEISDGPCVVRGAWWCAGYWRMVRVCAWCALRKESGHYGVLWHTVFGVYVEEHTCLMMIIKIRKGGRKKLKTPWQWINVVACAGLCLALFIQLE